MKFTPPAQYGFTAAKAGPETIDSDVTGTKGYGTTKVYRVLAGDRLPYIDAGLIAGVLPLEWLSFEGRYNGYYTELDWSTGIELNNAYFEIERRHESEKEFASIGREQADINASASRHDYGYEDHQLMKSGVYYYRIKQVDHDGSYTYSKVISIRVQNGRGLGVEIFPNPVDELLKVNLYLNEDSEVEVRVIDERGRVVMSRPFGGWRRAGVYNEVLNTQTLIPGQYHLQISTNSGMVNKMFTVGH